MKRNIVLFGAPGVGKGTYGKLLSKEFGYPTFSMGDYFRKVINESSTDNDDFVTKLKQTLLWIMNMKSLTHLNLSLKRLTWLNLIQMVMK
jgi:adenylate kinase family enzyme